MSGAGKGDARRPASVEGSEFERRWGQTFGRPRPLLIHVPRTGGTSIRASLGVREDEIHLTASAHRARLGAEYDRRYTFAFIRNPFDRAVSIFAFFHRNQPEAITPEGFREWAWGGMLHPSGRSPTLYVGKPYAIEVTAPQVAWLDDRIDYVGSFNDLEGGLRHVCAVMGRDATLQHRNGVGRDWGPAAFYDAATVDLIAARWAADVEVTGCERPGKVFRVLPGGSLAGNAQLRKSSSDSAKTGVSVSTEP